MVETWRKHPELPHLLLSSHGRAKTESYVVYEETRHFSAKIKVESHLLEPYLDKGRKVIKHLDELYFLDRLVYEAFHGEIPWGKRIHAINRDISDTRPCNLEIAKKKTKELRPPKPRGGKNHWNYDPTLYTFYHEDSGIVEVSTRSEFRLKHRLSSGCVTSMLRRPGGKSNGWTIIKSEPSN